MKSLAAIILIFISTVALAGPGHDHAHGPISKEAAGKMAITKLEQLVTKGTIDKSWSGKTVNTTEKKKFKKGPEWVITFKNESLADKSKHTLYMFYTLDGHYLAANFTGT